MPTRHADKLWAGGGLVAAVLLLALGWFVFIGPQYAEANAKHEQVIQAQVRLASQQRKLADLKRQNEDLPQYKAQLESYRDALPSAPETSNFLRELEVAGERAGVAVTGLTLGTRLDVPGAGGALYALPAALTVAGTKAELEHFVGEVQATQPRAVLIRSANLTVDRTGTTLTMNLHIFVVDSSPAAKPTK